MAQSLPTRKVAPRKEKIRTLSELQDRIIFLQQRLAKMMADPTADDSTKAFVNQFELQTIRDLKTQLRVRINWMLVCAGC